MLVGKRYRRKGAFLSKCLMWGGELEGGKYFLGSDASLNGAVSLCDCPLCGKKKWGLGGLLSIDFSEMVKCEPHSRLDRCNACGGGLMNKETMDHGILRRIIIASSAWCWINISYSHPRDWNIQVWRGQVRKEIKARATGISLVTWMGFLENKWRTEVSICNYWQSFRSFKQMQHFKMDTSREALRK